MRRSLRRTFFRPEAVPLPGEGGQGGGAWRQLWSMPLFHDTRFWYHALIGQMSACWQIRGAVDTTALDSAISLSKKNNKYACDLLQKEKYAFKISSFYYTLLWKTMVTFAKWLTFRPTFKRHSNNQSVDTCNACCVQLSLVLQERVKHNCTDISCEQLFLSRTAFSIYEVAGVACQ